jgi:hypothetical protein
MPNNKVFGVMVFVVALTEIWHQGSDVSKIKTNCV